MSKVDLTKTDRDLSGIVLLTRNYLRVADSDMNPETSITDRSIGYEFSLVERDGSLFWCPNDLALVHCVSQDCHMGAGIAKEFKNAFPTVGKLWHCKGKIGEAMLVMDGLRLFQSDHQASLFAKTNIFCHGSMPEVIKRTA